MKAMKVKGDVILNCIHCGHEYYLADAVEDARALRKRVVLCPHCGRRVAGC